MAEQDMNNLRFESTVCLLNVLSKWAIANGVVKVEVPGARIEFEPTAMRLLHEAIHKAPNGGTVLKPKVAELQQDEEDEPEQDQEKSIEQVEKELAEARMAERLRHVRR